MTSSDARSDARLSSGGRFELLRRLGAGGMGVVYEAHDRERNTRVALKTLQEQDAAWLYRFKQEFRSLASIAHPNLIPLYELFVEGDDWFFTMEILEGATDLRSALRPRVKAPVADTTLAREEPTAVRPRADTLDEVGLAITGRLPTVPVDHAKVRAAFRELATGVRALHAAGKLHRDLKPGNVMMRDDGRVVILDFGLVADLRSAPEATDGPRSSEPRQYISTERSIAGTALYMAPEQAAALPLGEPADWYAVGVMLFEVLTGRLPFEGSPSDVVIRKRMLDAPSARSIDPDIPEDLDALCAALLRREPSERPSGLEIDRLLGGDASSRATEDVDAPFLGRSEQRAALHRALDHARAGETVVVELHGASGAGKSALVDRFLADAGDDVLVLRGRCYEQESVPYKSVDGIVDALVRHLLHRPFEERDVLLTPHTSALARLFPVIERVQRGDESVAGLDVREARESGVRAFIELLGNLALEKTLLLHIDDLQWGDADGVEMLSSLITAPDTHRILVLLSYRSEYATRSASLAALSSRAARWPQRILRETIEVGALGDDDAGALARSLLGTHVSDERVARIVAAAAGLPYFVLELARAIEAEPSIADAPIGLDLAVRRRVERLPEAARRMLEAIAVAAAPIRLRHVREAIGVESLPHETLSLLRREHLIRGTGMGLDDEVESFHDRIREGVAGDLPERTRTSLHAALAETYERSGDVQPETIATHFERAGEPGRASVHYARAATEASRVLAFDRAEAFFKRAAALAPTDLARAAIEELLIHHYTDLARFADAYALGREAVARFGVSVPPKFVPPILVKDLALLALRMRGRSIASVAELPQTTDPRTHMAVKLMAAFAKAAYQLRPELCVTVANKMVDLCLRNGNAEDAAIGYMVHGAIFHGGVLGRHRVGYEYGKLARAIVDRYRNERQRAEVTFVVAYFATSWMRPAIEAEALYAEAFDAGLQVRDLFHIGCAAAAMVMSQWMRGVPLDEIERVANRLLETIVPMRLQEPIGTLGAVQRAIRQLRGEDPGAIAPDDATLATYGSPHFAHFQLVAAAFTAYVRGDIAAALATIERAAPLSGGSRGMMHSAEHAFVHALCLARVGTLRSRVRLSWIARQLRGYASDCATNFAAKSALIDAEAAWLDHKLERAALGFAEAARLAEADGHRHVRAIAEARRADLLRQLGRVDEAHLADAAAARARAAWIGQF